MAGKKKRSKAKEVKTTTEKRGKKVKKSCVSEAEVGRATNMSEKVTVAIIVILALVGGVILTWKGVSSISTVNPLKKTSLNHSTSQGVPGGENTNQSKWFEGKAKIWFCNRVLILKKGIKPPVEFIAKFLNPTTNLEELGNATEPEVVEFSCRKDVGACKHNGKVCFEHAVETPYGVVQWGMKDCDTGESVQANCEAPQSCAVYFTGIGCPHCAKTDPYLFYEFLPTHPIVLVEYEVYRESKYNAKVMDWYVENVRGGDSKFYGIPQIYMDDKHTIVGDDPILKGIENVYEETPGLCPVPEIKEAISSITKEQK